MFVVAGVTGHVGSVVAGTLLADAQQVRVVVRDAARAKPWSECGADVAVGSLSDEAFLTDALRGASGFFVLLPPDYGAVDVFTAQRAASAVIVRAVKASGVPHVVLLSSVGADLPSGTGPIKGLHFLEDDLRATGTQLTAIRAGYFQENIGNSLGPVRNAGIFPNFAASADYPMPMISTRDIGALAAEALLRPAGKSEIVDIHGPAYSIRQVAEKLGAALGKTVQVVDIPPDMHVGAMREAGMSQTWAETYAEMYAGFASGQISPKGDRFVQGETSIDATIKALLA